MSDWPITVAERSARTHGRRTLAKLLDAAVDELASHGYHGARMGRIAKAAGVAHGTLYVYFADKADLLAALQSEADAELRRALLAMPPIEPGPSGRDSLASWAGDVCAVFQRYGAVFQALAEALSDDEQSVAGRAGLRSMRATTAHMAERLRAACGESPEFDAEIAAICLFAMIEGGNRALHRGELPASGGELPASGGELPASGGELADEIARFVQRAAFGNRPLKGARG